MGLGVPFLSVDYYIGRFTPDRMEQAHKAERRATCRNMYELHAQIFDADKWVFYPSLNLCHITYFYSEADKPSVEKCVEDFRRDYLRGKDKEAFFRYFACKEGKYINNFEPFFN